MIDGVTTLCRALQSAGIDCVFGVPGTQNVALFEGFRKQGIRTVLTSHELAASFAANGHFRASGRIAALATIPGPGFTYALTGLAEARLDSVGVLYLVGRPAKEPGRRFQLQAIDQGRIAGPLVKACLAINAPADCTPVIRHAYELAISGEPGPVMIEIDLHALGADTIDAASIEFSESAPDDSPRGLDRLAELFVSSTRPVFLLGQGAFGAADRIRRVAEAATIPVVTTPSARGIVPEDSPLAVGFDPLRGHTQAVNEFLDRADLIVGIGCKLSHNGSSGFALRLAPDRFVHIDAASSVLNANYDAVLSITADAAVAAAALESPRTPSLWTQEELRSVRASVRARPNEEAEPVIVGAQSMRAVEFFRWLRAALPRDAIVVTDSGLHQILTRRHYDVLAPRGLICPSDFQSMGFGLPAAIGAKLAAPERPMVALIGDGGFLMSGMELLTARRERVPLLAIVFNDGHLNQIRLHQWADFGHAHAVDLVNPEYPTLAAAFGIGYLRFDECQPADVERALREPGPTLLEVVVRDSADMYRLPAIAQARSVVRRGIPRGLREWLKARLRL
jgi:acetolactate synthase I/II/III large subunit